MIACDEPSPTVPLDKQKAYFFSFNMTSSALACGVIEALLYKGIRLIL
jgi:hypothetical protein